MELPKLILVPILILGWSCKSKREDSSVREIIDDRDYFIPQSFLYKDQNNLLRSKSSRHVCIAKSGQNVALWVSEEEWGSSKQICESGAPTDEILFLSISTSNSIGRLTLQGIEIGMTVSDSLLGLCSSKKRNFRCTLDITTSPPQIYPSIEGIIVGDRDYFIPGSILYKDQKNLLRSKSPKHVCIAKSGQKVALWVSEEEWGSSNRICNKGASTDKILFFSVSTSHSIGALTWQGIDIGKTVGDGLLDLCNGEGAYKCTLDLSKSPPRIYPGE